MRIAVILLRWVLSFIYFFMKLLPVKRNKVIFLSRQSNSPSDDFLMLRDALAEKNPELEFVMITQRADGDIKSLAKFALKTLSSMRHLATAGVCVLDSYWPAVSILKHKDSLTVVQLWHAMGKIKKSGYQSVGKKLGRSDVIAKELRMHRNYDVIIAGGRAFNPFYCASFGVEDDILYNVGLPRMDRLREGVSAARAEFYSAYPELEGKRIVLYAPTFRKKQELDPTALVSVFDFDAGNTLIIKKHPNQRIKDGSLGRALTCDKVSTATVLSVCDCIITDYSAITIEAAILGKPVFFYLFDYEQYLSENGLNVKLFDEFPECTFRECQGLVKALESTDYDKENYRRFCKKYLPDLRGRATDKIADLIIDCIEKGKGYAISEHISRQNEADGVMGD